MLYVYMVQPHAYVRAVIWCTCAGGKLQTSVSVCSRRLPVFLWCDFMQLRHVVLHCSDGCPPGCDLWDNGISSGHQPKNRHQIGWLMIWTTVPEKTGPRHGVGGWEGTQSLSVLHHRKEIHYFLTSPTFNWIISIPYFPCSLSFAITPSFPQNLKNVSAFRS